MGRIEWYFWSLAHFRFLKHLMVFLRCNFFRASCLHLIKDTDSMYCMDMQRRFFKVKTLFNNAFKLRANCVNVTTILLRIRDILLSLWGNRSILP